MDEKLEDKEIERNNLNEQGENNPSQKVIKQTKDSNILVKIMISLIMMLIIYFAYRILMTTVSGNVFDFIQDSLFRRWNSFT